MRADKPEELNPWLTSDVYKVIAQTLASRYEECIKISAEDVIEGETPQTRGSRCRDRGVEGLRRLAQERTDITIIEDLQKRFVVGVNGVATRFFRADPHKALPKKVLGRFSSEKEQMRLKFPDDVHNQNIAWRFLVNRDMLTDDVNVALFAFDLLNDGEIVCAYDIPLQHNGVILASIDQKREEAVPQKPISVGDKQDKQEESKVVENG